MKVHGLLVCTYLFAQGDVDSQGERERERERERVFQSSIVWT